MIKSKKDVVKLDGKKEKGGFRQIVSGVTGFFSRYIKIVGSDPGAKTKNTESRDNRSWPPTLSALEKRLDFAAKGAFFGLLSFMFCGAALPFSAYPFGFALLAASGQYTPFVYVGGILSTVWSGDFPMATFLALTLGMLLRVGAGVWFSDGKKNALFNERTVIRVICGVSMAAMLGIYRCVSGGFLYYDLFGTLMTVGAIIPLTLIYCGAFDRRFIHSTLRDAGVAALVASGVFALRGAQVLGFSLSCILAFTATLYAARECGMLKAGILGLVCGLACSVPLAPMFALVGLAAGFFGRVGTFAGVVTSLGVGLLYCVYLSGAQALIGTAPDLLVASVIYAPLSRLGFLPKLKLYSGRAAKEKDVSAGTLARKKQTTQTERFEKMRDAFSSLADVFFRLSEKTRIPRPDEVTAGCSRVIEKHCGSCSKADSCVTSDGTSPMAGVPLLSGILRKKGRVCEEALPEYMRRKCFKLERVVDDLNDEYSSLIERRLRENKTDIFAADYEAMARLIGDAINAGEVEYSPDEELSKRVCRAAAYIDFAADAVGVYGKRRKRIVASGIDLARTKLGADDICRVFGKVCGTRFHTPTYTVEGDYVTMSMVEKDRFGTEYARSFVKKEGEDLCGDSISAFEGADGHYFVLLSDGMGSGTEAALTSRLCGVFLDKMLRAGNRRDVVLEMLNSLVRNKNLECFATVDLLDFDMLTGDGCFVKSGAAPSYVLRDGSLFRIESGSTPIGITREITGEEVKFKLQDGDIVVLTSDGVAQSFEDGLWLADMLTYDKHIRDLDEMCRRILDTAREKNARSDDMSVAMVRIVRS